MIVLAIVSVTGRARHIYRKEQPVRHVLTVTCWIVSGAAMAAQTTVAPPKSPQAGIAAEPQTRIDKPDTTYMRIDPSEIDCGLGWDQDLEIDGAVIVDGIDRPVIVKGHLTSFSCHYTVDPKQAQASIELVDGNIDNGVFSTKNFGPIRVGVRRAPAGFVFQLQKQYLERFREALKAR